MYTRERARSAVSVNTVLGASVQQVLPPNPRRCGLIISAQGGNVALTFDGSDPSTTSPVWNGLLICSANTLPLVIPEHMVAPGMQGPVKAIGANATSQVFIIEIFYAQESRLTES